MCLAVCVYKFIILHIGVNLAGILGDAEVDPEGLVGGREWGQQGEGSEEGHNHLPVKMKFSLEIAFFVNFLRYFLKIWEENLHPHSKFRGFLLSSRDLRPYIGSLQQFQQLQQLFLDSYLRHSLVNAIF